MLYTTKCGQSGGGALFTRLGTRFFTTEIHGKREGFNKGKVMYFLVMYVAYQELLYRLSLQNMRARWL